jgi:putative endonuclease
MFVRHRHAVGGFEMLPSSIVISSEDFAPARPEQNHSRGTLRSAASEPMRDEYIYYVYIVQSPSRRALYIGMTSNLRKRIWQHKNHRLEGFTDVYNCTRLVHWESFKEVANAIDREKQLKRWRREKKDCLVERKNPEWKDLAADWYETETQGPSTTIIVH